MRLRCFQLRYNGMVSGLKATVLGDNLVRIQAKYDITTTLILTLPSDVRSVDISRYLVDINNIIETSASLVWRVIIKLCQNKPFVL